MDRSYEIDKVKKKSGFSTFLKISSNILFAIVVILSIAIAILSSIFLRTPVIGPSMQPTINNLWTEQNPIQDTVLINRLDKGKRNDIIVIQKNAASEVNKYVIKRLIAIGGDKICIRPVYNKLNPSIITNHEILII
ncbi:MAG: S26 family signal peptidase, partial [Clostridia bacterium]